MNRANERAVKRAAMAIAQVLALSILSVGCATSSSTEDVEDIEVRDGQEALALLMAGNARFVAGDTLQFHESPERRAKLAEGQHPFGIVLGCADSRVPPELVFDTGLGDLFVIRVAGNVAGLDESGSIEYSLAHLGTPVVVVLGHEGCGAVTAVLDHPNDDEVQELEHLLGVVRGAVGEVDPSLPRQERVRLGVEANVRHQVKQLLAIQAREDLPEEQRALIVGAVYDVETGRVRVIETH